MVLKVAPYCNGVQYASAEVVGQVLVADAVIGKLMQLSASFTFYHEVSHTRITVVAQVVEHLVAELVLWSAVLWVVVLVD